MTTTVLWLNKKDLDIRCVRLKPYKLGDRLLLDVQQVIPLLKPKSIRFRFGVRSRWSAAKVKDGQPRRHLARP